MRLSEAIKRLSKQGFNKIGTWKLRGRNGITLGDPTKYFPYQVGPQYVIDTTEESDPELTDEEVLAIERRFGCSLTS
jgi:hypothetical protein